MGSNIKWDLKEKKFCMTNLESVRLLMAEEKKEVDILNVPISDILIIQDGIRACFAGDKIQELTEKIEELIKEVRNRP